MNIITPVEDFEKLKVRDIVALECKNCSSTFHSTKRTVNRVLNQKGSFTLKFCCQKCRDKYVGRAIECECANCQKKINKRRSDMSKTKNTFCSQSCAAIFNNAHKTHGSRRSKLEIWLEQRLKELYPQYRIEFNQKTAINSELDIFFPDLKLAFELNGIFHYEPIYGEDKLKSIQNNDHRKFAACAEAGISLCIIDTSKQKYFKESSCKEFLEIITKLVNQLTLH